MNFETLQHVSLAEGAIQAPDVVLAKLAEIIAVLPILTDIGAVKQLNDQAQTIRFLTRRLRFDQTIQDQAAEASIWTHRHLGQLTLQMEKNSGQIRRGCSLQPRSGELTYTALGLEKTQVHRAQALARVPEETCRKMIERIRRSGRPLSLSAIARLLKEAEHEHLRQQNCEMVAAVPNVTLAVRQRFPTLVMDPPWDRGDEGDVNQFGRATPTYATMTIDEIAALPIETMAEADAHLYLWITNRSLPKGFALLEEWGFRYVTMLTWVKPGLGIGNYFRGSTEQVLFGVRGHLPLLRRDAPTHFCAPRTERHSQKPELFFELVQSCSPGPWLELFARVARPGWVVWGEAGVMTDQQ